MLKKRTIFQFALLILFAAMLFYVRLDRVYDIAYEANKEAVKSLPSGGFSLRALDTNVSLDEPSAAVVISERPGETFEGTFLVKNHYDRKVNLSLIAHAAYPGDLEGLTPDERKDFNVRLISVDDTLIELGPREWKLVDYYVIVPDDLELNDYEGMVSLTESQGNKLDGVNLAYGVAVNFEIEVTDEPQDYQYEDHMDSSLSIHSLAMEKVYIEMQKIIGVGFAFLALFFFYMAFRSNKPVEHKKESSKKKETKKTKKSKKSKK